MSWLFLMEPVEVYFFPDLKFSNFAGRICVWEIQASSDSYINLIQDSCSCLV